MKQSSKDTQPFDFFYFSPLFVTWKRNHNLRGCIGTTTPVNLKSGLKELAIKSAIYDSRFDPITLEEFSDLNCSVSILIDYEPCVEWSDWEIGVHGVRLEYTDADGNKYHALYLPEVMSEHGNHIKTVAWFIVRF